MEHKHPKATRSTAALTVASLALATDALVYGMAVPLLPKLTSENGARPVDVGVLFAVYAAALVAVTPLVGRWVDRRGNRQPLLAGVIGLVVSTLLFAFSHDTTPLLVARALQGAAAGVVWTASLALIAATHAPRERGKAMGIALSSFAVGTLVGPPLGGLLTSWLDPRAPFLLATVLAVADGVARWYLVPHEGAVPEARGTLAEIRGRSGLVLVALLTAVGAALLAFLEPILPLHLFTTENAGVGAVGLVFGAAGVAAALAPPVAGILLRKVSPGPVAAGGCVVAAVAMIAVGAVDGVIATAAALAVVTIGASFVLTPTVTVMSEIAEAKQPPAYGSVYALYTLAYTGGLTIAPLGAGWAMQGLGFTGAARVAAGVAVLVAVVLLIQNWRLLQNRSRPKSTPNGAETPAESEKSV
ncbi:MFS transporter [Streptomyces sp. NPDC021093]|uniref:MFS transporter n=1 Tax=Streptomyces sp. NPDC021093 TaxID=3365112 RepID=UPI0037BC06D8